MGPQWCKELLQLQPSPSPPLRSKQQLKLQVCELLLSVILTLVVAACVVILICLRDQGWSRPHRSKECKHGIATSMEPTLSTNAVEFEPISSTPNSLASLREATCFVNAFLGQPSLLCGLLCSHLRTNNNSKPRRKIRSETLIDR